jgi:hypothetical protein
MSQRIDFCRDSGDDNGERPNSASIPSLSPSSKRLRDKKASLNDAHLLNGNGPRYKTATSSAGFVVDLELADKVEVSPYKKRRVVISETKPSGSNDAVGNDSQILKGVDATEKDVGGEVTQLHVAGHRESHHEGIAAAAAASHPINSDQ